MTRIPLIGAAIAIAAALASAAPASAQIVLEANGARADGRWGGELGAGYGFGAAGFRLTPMVGALVDRGDDDTVKPYGRIEATYAIPLVATVGAGIRAGDDLRPYGTVALPLLPAISLKGNAGPHYFALGLRLGL